MTPAVTPVLVVDDQAPFRSIARQVLELTPGFAVVGEAESGEEAVQLAEALQPTIVLMDINLPGIDGIEATRRILAAAPATVVVLLSTYRESDLPADASTCGARRYLHKADFDPGVLLEVLDHAHPPVTG